MSIFSDDQEEKRIPILEQEDSKKKHLAVKAEEWNEPGAREGVYTATLMYLLSHGNDSSGSKLNCIEDVKKELGNAIGGETGRLWKNVGAKDWYHVVKQKLYKRAIISPFEAMGASMVTNDEKEPSFQIRAGTAGKKIKHTPRSIS